MSGLEVIKPGVISTVQDWGRYGQRLNGLSTGGPMDEHAFLWANHLLGNSPRSAAIELTIGLAEFESRCNTMIAVCGADMGLKINNNHAENWSTHAIKVGDKLKFGAAKAGLRAYLAIQSGFELPAVFGSTATVVREALGGIKGRALLEHDVLNANSGSIISPRQVPHAYRPVYHRQVQLDFIPSYQFERFESDQSGTLSRAQFTVSPRMDRMGCQLLGEPIHYQGPGIISEGVALGSIQVPPDGNPIVLLKDAGSIGGYPKLGCVSRLSLNKLAQCRAGDKIRFSITDAATCCQKLTAMYAFFKV